MKVNAFLRLGTCCYLDPFIVKLDYYFVSTQYVLPGLDKPPEAVMRVFS